MTAQQIALRTALTVMYRPPRKSALKPLVEGARARHNLHLAPANLSGVRILAKTLKSGQPIGLLPDQVPQEGEGVWAPFFGRNAYTMTLPAKLAQLGKADILLVYAERRPHGAGYIVRFVRFDGDLSGTRCRAGSRHQPRDGATDRPLRRPSISGAITATSSRTAWRALTPRSHHEDLAGIHVAAAFACRCPFWAASAKRSAACCS